MPLSIRGEGNFLDPADYEAVANGASLQTRMAVDDLRRGQPRGRADFWTAAGRQPRDALEALTHAACRQLGAPVTDEHPLAQQVSQWSWEQLILGASTVGRGKSPSDIRAALSQSETGDLLGDAATTIASGVWSSYLPSFSFAKVYPAQDYRPMSVGVSKLGEFTEPLEDGQVEQTEIAVDAAVLTMKRYALRLPVSLEAVAGSPSIVRELVTQPLHAGIRMMRRVLFDALVASSDLEALTSTSMDLAGLNSAFDTLAGISMPGSGSLDLPVKHVLVSSAQHATMATLLQAAGGPALGISLHSSPQIPSGTWFALPSSEHAPVIGLAVPPGGPFELPPPRPARDFDGMVWDARLSFGVSVVSGLGVRVTA